jgi:hypothetical protein
MYYSKLKWEGGKSCMIMSTIGRHTQPQTECWIFHPYSTVLFSFSMSRVLASWSQAVASLRLGVPPNLGSLLWAARAISS